MPPMDSSNSGQVFGRILANSSLALVFYNPAPAMQTSTNDKRGRLTSSDGRSQESTTTTVAAREHSVCCDELCWEELSSGAVAMGTGNSVSGQFEIEDVWSGKRNGTVVTAGKPFCVELEAEGESSRTYRLDPVEVGVM